MSTAVFPKIIWVVLYPSYFVHLFICLQNSIQLSYLGKSHRVRCVLEAGCKLALLISSMNIKFCRITSIFQLCGKCVRQVNFHGVENFRVSVGQLFLFSFPSSETVK